MGVSERHFLFISFLDCIDDRFTHGESPEDISTVSRRVTHSARRQVGAPSPGAHPARRFVRCAEARCASGERILAEHGASGGGYVCEW